MSLWQQLSRQISEHTQSQYNITSQQSLHGGCINSAYKISDGKTAFFVKLNDLKHGEMFKAEALSLEEMFKTSTVRVPEPVCYGETSGKTFLVMEFLDLSGQLDSIRLGQQLASMHRISTSQFGWHQDNTIGSTPQLNQPGADWVEFWRQQRLLPQLQLAQRNGYARALSPLTDRLLDSFHLLFSNHHPSPSMLHGDLWGGNASALKDGTPVIYDPAFYFGDREADIAMTYLFGGFDRNFYAAYNETWPLEEGFKVRKTFYNLYHIINHLNLFGTGYLGQAISMTEQLLAEIE